MHMNSRRPLIHVAHPGTQHSFRLARVLEAHGRLGSFCTTLAFSPDSWLGRRFPTRAITGIPEAKVRRLESWREWVNVLGSRLPGYEGWKDAWWLSRNRAFGARAGRWIGEKGDIVLGPDTASAEMFGEAKRRGLHCVLDQSSVHSVRAEKILASLAEKRPAYAQSLAWKPYPFKEIERRCREAKQADLILCASEEVRASVIEAGAELSRVKVLPYGIDLDAFKPGPPRSQNPFRVIFVGNLTQAKGVGYLLEAWKRADLRDAELILAGGAVGGFDWSPWMISSARQIGRVSRSELIALLQQSHVFALPTSLEGQANAVLEAMACGCCVVTTRASGAGERIQHEGNALLLEPDDLEGWVETFRRLASDRTLTERLGQRGSETARDFSIERYGERVLEALQSLENLQK